MQSSPHFQTSSSDSPQTTTPATELLVHQQSRMVDNVLTRYTSQLTEAFSSNLHYFSNKFIELDFINRDAASEIDTMGGIGNRGKANKLLDLVIANFHISHDPKTWFSEFVSVFSSEAPYASLAMSMREDFEKNVSHSSSIPCTTRPSLPLSEPQSIYTNIQSRMSSQLQGSTPLDAIIDHVKTTYRESKVERQTAVVKWPPTPSKVYINLACLDRRCVSGRSRIYDEVTEAMVRDGNVDAIVNVTKGPIDFSEIAKNISITNSRERATSDKKKGDKKRLILVEGAPGVGKSTFALEFCRRWERGEIAQQYQLVLLLRLREERISNAKSLKDLIYHPLEDVPQAVCHELVRSHDFHALIILEGFDELSDISRKSGSVFMDLIAGKLLPLTTVLVTSRPWATRGIRLLYGNRIYQHIEILGFTGHQITEYIESTLPQDKASDLKAYLESHPQIRACMYIPLNSAIVVTVYEESQDSECPMPTTLTDLYTTLTLTLLLRYLRGHPEYGADCKSLRTFKDLPQPVYAKFCKVCKLAYDGTVGNSSVSTRHLISRYPPQNADNASTNSLVPHHYLLPVLDDSTGDLILQGHSSSVLHDDTFWPEYEYSIRHQVQLIFRDLPSDFDDLGFMDSVTELYVTQGAVSSYNFLHLTFQEFFAAVHISSMSPAQQAEHFKRLKEGRFKVVLRFLAGLNKLHCFSIEETANNFFQTPSTHEGSRYLISCDAVVEIDIVQWLFEAQSEDVIECVLGLKTLEFNLSLQMLPLDYYSLGYCISHSQCQWMLELGEKKISETGMRMLADGAGTRREPRGRVVGLSGSTVPDMTKWESFLALHQLRLKVSKSCDPITWPDLSQLRVLELSTTTCDITNLKLNTLFYHLSLESLIVTDSNTEGVEAITASLASNQSLPLESLELKCNCRFTTTTRDNLAQFIANTTTLKYLSMQGCAFNAHTLLVIARAMHRNSILQTKNLEKFTCTLTVNGNKEAKDFNQLLVEYPDLVVYNCIGVNLTVYNKDISIARVDSQAQAHPHNCSQTLLDLSNTGVNDAGAEGLALTLHHNSTLTELELYNNTISDGGTVALAQALHHNSTMTLLNLSENSINYAGAAALAQALHHNSTLTQLDLSNNSSSDPGAEALAQALHHNSTLTWLNLCNNIISDTGAVDLAQALHHNSTMANLYLFTNNISDAGAAALAQALHHNSALTLLDLSENSISDAGAVALAQALHHNSTLTQLNLSGNDGIGEEGTHKLVQALSVNTSVGANHGGLRFPKRCEEYAKECPQYHTVKNRIIYISPL